MDRLTPWPVCGTCRKPMVFRAQLPLAVSALVGADDDRMVLVFECHGWVVDEPCTDGAALIARGRIAPRTPPAPKGPSPDAAALPVLEPRGGMLIPFDDTLPGSPLATLPPLESIAGTPRHGRLLGLLGGPTPGSIDASTLCDCGRPLRTVVRLLAMEAASRPPVYLGPTLVQACLRCNVGSVHRMILPRA